MGDRAFQVAGLRTWNSLPANIRETKTLPISKNTWNCTWSVIPSISLDIALTVNILVKHPRSGLPPTVLYNSSYLQLQLQLQLQNRFHGREGGRLSYKHEMTSFHPKLDCGAELFC